MAEMTNRNAQEIKNRRLTKDVGFHDLPQNNPRSATDTEKTVRKGLFPPYLLYGEWKTH